MSWKPIGDTSSALEFIKIWQQKQILRQICPTPGLVLSHLSKYEAHFSLTSAIRRVFFMRLHNS